MKRNRGQINKEIETHIVIAITPSMKHVMQLLLTVLYII